MNKRVRYISLPKDQQLTINSINKLPYFLLMVFNASYSTSEGYSISIIYGDKVKTVLGSIITELPYSVSNYNLTLRSNINWNIPVIVIGRTQIIN